MNDYYIHPSVKKVNIDSSNIVKFPKEITTVSIFAISLECRGHIKLEDLLEGGVINAFI